MTDQPTSLDEILDKHFSDSIPGNAWNKSIVKQAILDRYISKQRVVEAFKLLEHGHGGGNWRRLVIQAREALGLEEKPE